MRLFDSALGSWKIALIAVVVSALYAIVVTFFLKAILPDFGYSEEAVGPAFILTLIATRLFNLFMRGKNPHVDEIYARRGYSIASGNALGIFLGSLVSLGMLFAFIALIASFALDRKG